MTTWKTVRDNLTPSRVFLGAIALSELSGIVASNLSAESLYKRAEDRARATGRTFVTAGGSDHTGGSITNIPADSAVVFARGLEYVDDVNVVYASILRIAGSPENIFIARMPSWSLIASLWPGARWVINHAPPDGTSLIAEPVGGMTQRFLALGVATTAIDAFKGK